METITMDVEGMSCQGCVSSVTRVLKATPGVQEVRVTLQPGRAKVTFDPACTGAAQLRSAIEEAGYAVA